MARLLVMYKTPRDAAAFDKHYADKHVPLAKKIPGLRKFEVSRGSDCDARRAVRLSPGRDPAFRRYGGDPEGFRQRRKARRPQPTPRRSPPAASIFFMFDSRDA